MAFTPIEIEARKAYRRKVKLEGELGRLEYERDVAEYKREWDKMSDIAKQIREIKLELENLSLNKLKDVYNLSPERIEKLGKYQTFVDGDI